MGYINIFVSQKAHLSVKNSQLYIKNEEKQQDYPLEDINSVMIENLSSMVSTYTLSKIAEQGILLFVCNQSHLPSGVMLPFCEHYQTLSVFEQQAELSKPLKKQLWQEIVKNKILNQNEVLNICGGNDVLKKLAEGVLSGDSGNNEAKASLVYFKELFGKEFARRTENAINTFLNYGYSIIRGFVARSIAVHGLQPFLGINHCNQFNSFNLADDLMEVFRPIVDLYVKIYLSDEKEINSQIKMDLFNIVNFDVDIDGNKQTVANAIDIFVENFVKSIKEQCNKIKQVKIFGLEMHKYE